MWQAFVEHWYLWMMIPSWPLTTLLYCWLAKQTNSLDDGTIIVCTILAAISQIAWVAIWGVFFIILIFSLWADLVKKIFSPSKKDAEEIANKETKRIIKYYGGQS